MRNKMRAKRLIYMQLTKLINNVKVIQVAGEVERKDIDSIVYDSRKVTKGALFVAIKGEKTDGHRYILEAINSGAAAIVLEDNSVVPDDIFIHENVTKILVKNSREAMASLSSGFFKEPSKKLKVVGVTGTKGKTTTTFILKSIFESAGAKTGLIGTIANYIGEKRLETSLTTPESCELNKMFAEMAERGIEYAAMEVSSHSLSLKRVHDIYFRAGIYTNLGADHLDFHNTREEYAQAKKILFDSLDEKACLIYNSDDEFAKKIISGSKAKRFSFGSNTDLDFQICDITYDLEGTRFIIKHNAKNYNIETGLVGEFNAYNATAAFATAISLDFSPEEVIQGIKKVPQVPGRFEKVERGGKKAIIDYSHNPESLEKTLMALNKIVGGQKKIYTVVGCGGNRDKTKRPIMGEIATRLSYKAFITSDNPRFEDPYDIIKDIEKGIHSINYEIIESREEAIKKAILDSEKDSVILIAGKGHETYQEIKGVRNKFSDAEVAEKYLNRL